MASDETTDSGRDLQAADRFDLRRIIGGLFLLYGVVLTVMGLLDGDAEIERAAGVRINLWAGLGMLLFALLFLAWSFWRPLSKQIAEEERASAS